MKYWFLVVIFSVCSFLYADKMDSNNVLRPCPEKVSHFCNATFEVFGEWLYLQPNGSNIYYAAEAFPYNMSIAEPAVSPHWKIFEIDPSYRSGFEVGINTIFQNSDTNLELSWERLHTDDKASMNVTPISYGTGNMVGPIYDIGPNSEVYKSATGHAYFHFDEVNLVLVKSICFVKHWLLRPYLGASFARVKQEVTSFYASQDRLTSRTIDSDSSYWGIGPQFGLTIEYNMIRSLRFVGNSALSFYMGRMQNQTTFKSNAPYLASVDVTQPNVQQTEVPNRSQLVPGLEQKLGFAYAHSYKHTEINFEIGYLFQIYFNAVQSMDMLTQGVPVFDPGAYTNAGVFAVTFNRTLDNFILTGPYISLNLGF